MSAVRNRADPDTASAAGFVQDLADAARDNPISTALISVGALWLFMGGSGMSIFGDARGMGGAVASKVADSLLSAGAPVSQAATTGFGAMRDQVAGLSTAGGETLSASSSRVAEVTGSIGGGIKTAGDLASQTGASITDMAGAAPQRARELVMPLQNGLADLWDRQPLILGALGLAIGASLAAALPHLAVEDEMFGEAGEQLKTQAKGVFSEHAAKVGDMIEAVTAEAQRQGLTPGSAKQAVRNLAGATEPET